MTLDYSDDDTLQSSFYAEFSENNNGTITIERGTDKVIVKNYDLYGPNNIYVNRYDNSTESMVTSSIENALGLYIGTNSDDNIDLSSLNKNAIIYCRDGNDTIVGSNKGNVVYTGNGTNTIQCGTCHNEYIYQDFNCYDIIYSSSNKNIIDFTNTDLSIDDMIFYFDMEIDSDGNIVQENSMNLYITKKEDFGKSNVGIKVVDNFEEKTRLDYSANYNSICQIDFSDGCFGYEDINQLRQNIAGWLYDNGFGSVQSIIDSHDETNINNLIAAFQNTTW